MEAHVRRPRRRGRAGDLVGDLVPGGDSTDPTPVVTDWTSSDLITLFLSVRALGASLGKLHRGVYRFTVYATDLAGNHQVKAGSSRLVVR
jgi:hypothetical protein